VTSPRTVLIVDDDPHVREVVRFALEREGFRTVEAPDGRSALEAFAATRPDLVVLDVLMPELDGTEVCRALRRTSPVPIVFLSSRDEEVDRIVGLEIGGDDYVTKPFSPRELVARVKAVLRRAAAPAEPPVTTSGAHAPRRIVHGRMGLDLDRCEALWDSRPIPLTATELGILRTLLSYPGKVFTRDALMAAAYDEANVVADRTIDSHVRRLRKKLGDGADAVETVHGIGYRLGDCR
jgi:two-component system OmpR family response regulator